MLSQRFLKLCLSTFFIRNTTVSVVSVDICVTNKKNSYEVAYFILEWCCMNYEIYTPKYTYIIIYNVLFRYRRDRTSKQSEFIELFSSKGNELVLQGSISLSSVYYY